MAHEAINIEGYLRWTLNDIPAYAEEPYVMLISFMMAGEFERSPDSNMYVMAMRQLARGANLQPIGETQAEYF